MNPNTGPPAVVAGGPRQEPRPMPHFNAAGEQMIVCQKGGHLFTDNPEAYGVWVEAGSELAAALGCSGNVCKRCLGDRLTRARHVTRFDFQPGDRFTSASGKTYRVLKRGGAWADMSWAELIRIDDGKTFRKDVATILDEGGWFHPRHTSNAKPGMTWIGLFARLTGRGLPAGDAARLAEKMHTFKDQIGDRELDAIADAHKERRTATCQ